MKRLYIVFISIVFLVSCNPCEEVDCPNPFTEEELSWLPYKYNDQLIFLEMDSSDSLVYRISYEEGGKREPKEAGSPYCITACFYSNNKSGERVFSNGEKERFGFGMQKFINRFILIANGTEFDLSEAVLIDSIDISGNFVKDVYKYNCKSEQDKVAETYMHQGMGLVKIVFRNGQEFELVEHRKTE